MASLVIAAHDGAALDPATLNAATAAAAFGGDIDVLVAGGGTAPVAGQAAKIAGVARVRHADDAAYDHLLAEAVAPLVVALAGAYSEILFPANTTGKNLAPRVAALLDVAQISDITEVVSADTFVRPIYAGNAMATVRSRDAIKVITVRGTAFAAAALDGDAAIEPVSAGEGQALSKFLRQELSKSERPELTSPAPGSWSPAGAACNPRRTSTWWNRSRTASAQRWALRARRWMRVTGRTTSRSARPARWWRPSSTSRSAFRARSSIWPA